MIVERFLEWMPTAGAADRAAAAGALARAYLASQLTPEERDGMETAMTLLLDDPSPEVRRALAEALCRSAEAPHHIILALASDKPQIAAIVAESSPLLLDSELVDMVGTGAETVRLAVARRPYVSRAVAAAISEVASAAACVELLCNGGARVARFSLDRIVERHGDDAELRDVLLRRDDLPVDIRQTLVAQFAGRIRGLLGERQWLAEERADIVVREAREKATITIAFEAPADELPVLVDRLLATDALTPAFLIRAAASGQEALFAASLAALASVPLARARAIVAAGRPASLRALLRKARLPARSFAAFEAAMAAMRHAEGRGASEDYRRATHLIDAVIAAYPKGRDAQTDEILALLRRFAAEAKRDAARARAGRASCAA